jgi:nicotinate-nucleotide pyrophosphorylase
MSFPLPGFDIDAFVRATLAEDLGDAGDITSTAVIPEQVMFRGVMASRDAIVLAGLPIAEAFFRSLDPDVVLERLVEDGASVPADTELLWIEGRARDLLTAERSALNTLQHLSGVATLTRAYVGAIAGTGAILLDTRKTNMEPNELRDAVALVAGRVPTEASGGVTLETIRAKAETGVTYISVGRLTQSAPAADIGLDFSAA